METLGTLGLLLLALLLCRREEALEHCLSRSRHTKAGFALLICFLLSLRLALCFDLSPLHLSAPDKDSSIFLYIGRAMYEGAVPYRDLFDHKGPVLYWLEYLGYVIGFGSYRGVWVVELINLCFTLLLLYRTARLFSRRRVLCWTAAWLVIDLNRYVFQGGNFTEEYALPWISLTLFLVLRFFVTGQYRKRDVAAIGFAFGVVFFLRVNMVGLWAALLLAVACALLRQRRGRELFSCALLFLLGLLPICALVFAYLAANGALASMLRYYFVFNFFYSGLDDRSKTATMFFFFYWLSNMRGCCILLLLALVARFRDKALWVNTAALLVAFLSAAVSGREYLHYLIILLPFFVAPAALVLTALADTMRASDRLSNNRALAAVTALSLLCVVFYPAYHAYAERRHTNALDEIVHFLRDETQPEDDVLVLDSYAAVYLLGERGTQNKFFYQEPAMEVGDMLYEEFTAALRSTPSDYILFCSPPDAYIPEKLRLVLSYLNEECAAGRYTLQLRDSYQVYVKKG